MFISLFQGIGPPLASAASSKTVLRYQKEISKDMRWQSEKWVTYPNSAYGTYPSTYNYDSGGYTGTLNATRIKLVPKEKIYHKDPIYRTDTYTFTKNTTKTYGTNSNSNVPSTYYVNENGYSGNIPRTSLSWTSNWVRNRTKSLTQYWTDSSYREFSSEVPEPATFNGTYYDSTSGKNVSYSLPKSGGLYSIASKNQWIRYRAPGRAAYYDKYENYYLGFMSSNSSTYYAGRFSDARPGEAPDRYYGIPRAYTGFSWRLVNYGWDEANAVNADWWASQGYASKLVYSNGSYWWRSESGRLNKYRKGVWIDYDIYVPVKQYRQKYSGTFNLPDYIKDYTAQATYKGTLSKQVLDHYDEYYTSSKWDVYVEYTGTIYTTNLKAKSIAITDTSGNPVSYLVRGKNYKATMVIENNGELNVGAYKVGFYEEGTRKTLLDVSSHNKGSTKTLTYSFTASTSGQRTFMVKADDTNVISETNESDNTASQDKNVYYVNLKAKSINITDPSGNAVSFLVRGKTYRATMIIGNDGEIDTGAYKVGFYEQGSRKTLLDVSSHAKGTDKTLTYSFTASTSGAPRTFMVKADDANVIEESNENDNTASQNKNVYYVNLKAKSIDIKDTNGNPVTHLVKGRSYNAVMVIGNDGEINTSAYKVGFYESGTRKATLDISSHSKGTDKTLTYTFTATTSGTRTFMAKADDLDIVEETNEGDNTVSISRLVNTLPVVTLTYSPSDVYEGDTVNVCAKPTDADNNPLVVKIFIKKDGGTDQVVLNKSNIASGTSQCYSFVTEVGRYDIRATVNDGYDETGTSTWFYSKALIINGRVNHTVEWEKKHLDMGHALNQFYSGEKFLLESDTSPYPTVYVKSTLRANQADSQYIERITNMTGVSTILYKGELFDPKFQNYPTNIKKGPATFEFEVKYTNGVIKKDLVQIQVIDDVFEAYRFHRRF